MKRPRDFEAQEVAPTRPAQLDLKFPTLVALDSG